ncbi:MAG: cytosolic protein, partial [bacterium]|nr:cytosolic protein [bacterium]
MREASVRADYDSPWKEFLTVFFRQFIGLVLPELHEMIDWSHPIQFLDNELRRLTPRSETGRLYTDRLVKVRLRGGGSQAILVHLEAQSQFVNDMEERVFTYHARVWIEVRLPIVNIVIYADKHPTWAPDRYVHELPGTRLEFQFHAVKLLQLDETRLMEAARQGNPAALVLLAFRKAMETENDVELRFEVRQQLTQLMIEFGYNEEDQAHIQRLMEWVLMLPETLEQQVQELIEEYKRERGTTFVSSLERRAIEQGLQQGLQEGFQQGLEQGLQQGLQQGLEQGLEQATAQVRDALLHAAIRRFGSEAETLRADLAQIRSSALLLQLFNAVMEA